MHGSICGMILEVSQTLEVLQDPGNNEHVERTVVPGSMSDSKPSLSAYSASQDGGRTNKNSRLIITSDHHFGKKWPLAVNLA